MQSRKFRSRLLRAGSGAAAVSMLVLASCGNGTDEAEIVEPEPTARASATTPASPTAVIEQTPIARPGPTPSSTPEAAAAEPTVMPSPTPAPLADPFPPAGLRIVVESEFVVGELARLVAADRWLFGVRSPSVLVRADPTAGQIDELELDFDASAAGPPQLGFAGDSLWALGGLGRDSLVEVDPATLT